MDATIVHLSDLHFKNDVENRFRLKRFRADLERLQVDGPIYTVFTGDLVHAGDDDVFNILFDELFSPLIGWGHEVFIVPGNHDIQRSIANEEFVNKILVDRGSSYLFGTHRSIQNNHPDETFDSLVNYRLLEDILAPYDQRSYWGYTATKGPVSILGLNSAWLCCERASKQSDRGSLRVEPAIVDALAESLPPDTLRIALLHHPLDWLEETTRSAVNDLLIKHIDLVLFGHVHTKDVVGQVKRTSRCLFLQAPPLRAGWSKGTNGYAIIRANVTNTNKFFEVEYRSYSQPRREFVVGEDFASGGRLHPRPEDAEFFYTAPSRPALLQRFIDNGPYDYLDWYRNHVRAKSKVTGSFVVPKVHRVIANEEGPIFGPPRAVTQVIEDGLRDQFFVAPLDAGSTTAAYLAFKHLSETFSSHLRIPAYFDAGRETINKASILRKISQTTLTRYTYSEVERLVTQGSIVVVVDGLCLGDIEQFNLFRDTVDRHLPNVRFIHFLSTERRGISPSGKGDPRLSTKEDEIYEFAELEVDDIRSMISMRDPKMAEKVREGIVSHVIECFRQMDEPIYASTVAVVLDTVIPDPEFTPLNKARLIERYVECLLGRFDLEDVREGTFASSDKIKLLCFIARQCLQDDTVGMDEARWTELTQNYEDRFLIELPKGLLDEFLEKGLLTMDRGKITFRGDHLFSFFVAQAMKSDTEFAASLVQGHRLFRHHREITVYGELEGTNVGNVLDELYSQLGEIETTLLENFSRDGINLTEEWAAACAETESEAASKSLEEAAIHLGSATSTTKHADLHDNAELAKVQRRRGVAERQTVRAAEAQLLVGMRLYGLLLKNALHVEAQEKLRHLKKLFESAEFWVGFLCARRAFIGRLPIFMANGICFINQGAAIDPDRSYYDFKFNAPNSASRLISDALRNPQLAIAIRRLIPDLDPMSRLFARDILLEMPGSQNSEKYLVSLKKEKDVNLMTCALRTLRTKYLAAGRNQDRREHLERILEGIAKDSKIASRVNFNNLRKARLVQDLRDNAAGGAS